MKRVSSAPSLQDLASGSNSTNKGIGSHPKPSALSGQPPSLMGPKRSSNTKLSAMAVDAPLEGSIPSVPQSTELVYALTETGLQSLECLPLEMKDAPSLDLADCLATPVLPDQGQGEELRQRVSAMNARAETLLRLRYAEEITSRAGIAMRRRRDVSRKRSLDDLDLHEALQELENSKPKRLSDVPPKEDNPKSNVKPFKRPVARAVVAAATK